MAKLAQEMFKSCDDTLFVLVPFATDEVGPGGCEMGNLLGRSICGLETWVKGWPGVHARLITPVG